MIVIQFNTVIKKMNESAQNEEDKIDTPIYSQELHAMYRDPSTANKMRIIVKWLEPTIMFGQNLIVCVINVLGPQTPQMIEKTRLLLSTYSATYYNFFENNVKQIYTGPQSEGFSEQIWDGYFQLYSITGNFIVGNNLTNTSIYYKGEKLDTITSLFSYRITIDTQPFFDTFDNTQSIAKYGTMTINFGCYLTDNDFCNDVLDVILRKTNVNTKFDLMVKFSNGKTTIQNSGFTLIDASIEESIGDFPALSVAFTY